MKISIIILSYNDYPGTTGLCLASLSKDAEFGVWDIIVIDNASDSVTKVSLQQAQKQFSSVRFVLNERNLGYAAGNNIGIRMSTGDVVILLNSDIVVPVGMIGRMVAHFTDNNKLGMVGPVTNAAGNEQCIYTKSVSMEEKIKEGLSYATNNQSETLLAYRLDFFCVAIPSHVLKQVGELDEEFGRGYYEDLDYSLRVKAAGFNLGVAEDTFVYHRGSTSFGKIPSESKALLKRNKRLIIRKYGTGVIFQHVRQANLAILSQYLSRKIVGAEVPSHRITNRLQQAQSELPKSWLKRWRYLRQVRKLSYSLAV